MRACTDCREEKPETSEFFDTDSRYAGGLTRRCKVCKNRIVRAVRLKRRMQVLEHYGGSPPECACCGESNYKFLAIDHVDGGGKAHRRELGRGTDVGNLLIPWLIRNGYPDGFQVLCHNCNLARGFYGSCHS